MAELVYAKRTAEENVVRTKIARNRLKAELVFAQRTAEENVALESTALLVWQVTVYVKRVISAPTAGQLD